MGVDKILLALALTGLASLASAADSKTANSSKPTTTQTTVQQTGSQQPSRNNAVVSPEDIKRFKAGNSTKAEVK